MTEWNEVSERRQTNWRLYDVWLYVFFYILISTSVSRGFQSSFLDFDSFMIFYLSSKRVQLFQSSIQHVEFTLRSHEFVWKRIFLQEISLLYYQGCYITCSRSLELRWSINCGLDLTKSLKQVVCGSRTELVTPISPQPITILNIYWNELPTWSFLTRSG